MNTELADIYRKINAAQQEYSDRIRQYVDTCIPDLSNKTMNFLIEEYPNNPYQSVFHDIFKKAMVKPGIMDWLSKSKRTPSMSV